MFDPIIWGSLHGFLLKDQNLRELSIYAPECNGAANRYKHSEIRFGLDVGNLGCSCKAGIKNNENLLGEQSLDWNKELSFVRKDKCTSHFCWSTDVAL